jgi:glutathione S-transferase
MLISIMRHGISQRRMRRLSEAVGVDRRTIVRWRLWWREAFVASSFWQMARGAFMPPVDEDGPPAALVERFAGSAAERMLALLRFLAPITGGQLQVF